MTDYPIVRFVADAGVTAARLDLNDAAPFTVDHEGFSFGAPTLEADPLSYAAPYGWRTIAITPSIVGGPAAAAPALSKLSVELLRRTNWLMFQFDAASQPVWIQIYKSAPPPLEFSDIAVGEPHAQWRLSIEITADAFIRGRRVDIDGLVVTNNPLNTNGVTIALPPIIGDAPAELNVNIQSNQAMYQQTWLAGTTAVDERCTYDFSTPIALPTADFGVPGGSPLGDLAQGNDALGAQFRRATGLTAGWKTAMQNPSGDLIPIGHYRVFGRLREVATGDNYGTIGIRLGGRYEVSTTFEHAWQSERRVRPNGYFGWHDLGSLFLPVGARPNDPDMRGRRRFGVQVRKINGDNPSVDFGGFMLIPIAMSDAVADSRMLRANTGQALFDATETLQINSRQKRLERNPRDLPLPYAKASGGYPQVVPGYVNYLHICGDLHMMGAQSVYDLNRTYTLNARYFPQYLHPVIA